MVVTYICARGRKTLQMHGFPIQTYGRHFSLAFLWAVKTNVGYSVVAEFVVQSETADRKHGLSPEEGDTLLSLLRDVAQTPSPPDSGLPLDHNYHQHVNNLKQSYVWKKNALVQEWLEGKWLCSPQVKILRIRSRYYGCVLHFTCGKEVHVHYTHMTLYIVS